jgi:hypothetical protein
MKIKINTKAKIVQIEGKVSRTELGKILGSLLKNHKDYRIEEVAKFQSWNDPIVFDNEIPLKIGEFTNIYNIEV